MTTPAATMRRPRGPSVQEHRWIEPVAGICLVTMALFQNLWNLDAANYSADEHVYADAGWAYVHGDFSDNFEHPFVAKYLAGLAQLLLGRGVESARVAAALASLLTGVVIWWWLRREVGRATAMLAAAMWALLPSQMFVLWGPRIDRYMILEPFMIMFAVLASAACWRWTRSGGWAPVIVSAVAIALAGTSKVTILVIGPVLIITPFIARRDRRTAVQAGAFLAIAGGTAVLTYLPSGQLVTAVRYLIEFQAEHAERGHRIEFAGMVSAFPPWWANLYWLATGIGWIASAGLIIGAILVAILDRSALTIFVSAILATLAVFLLLISSVALPHYYYAFLPWLIILAAIGLTAPWRTTTGMSLRWIATSRLVALLAGLLLVVSAVSTSVAVAQLRPWGAARIEEALAEAGKPAGPVLVSGLNKWEYRDYVDRAVRTYQPDIVAIAIYRDWLRGRPDPRLLRLVDDHPEAFDLVQLDGVELYIVREPLAP